MTKASYLTTNRLRDIASALSDRDHQLIADVDRLGLVSGVQLRRLYYDDTPSDRRLCRLHLARLTTARVLLRLDRRRGGVRAGSDGFVYALDVAGRRLVDPDRVRYWPRRTPGAAFLDHALSVSELYVGLRTMRPQGALKFASEPACWRWFGGLHGARLTLKPDAHVVIDSGAFEDHYFVEVDRSTEALPRIMTKLRLYLQHWQSGREQARTDVYPLVLWLVPDDRRHAQLTGAIARLKTDQRALFAVAVFDEAASAMWSGTLTGASS